jgi:hypothetical protein
MDPTGCGRSRSFIRAVFKSKSGDKWLQAESLIRIDFLFVHYLASETRAFRFGNQVSVLG